MASGVYVVDISFVIPAFNEEDNIGRLLDSIKLLKNIVYEIIVVDNGSSDNTVEIVLSKGVTLISFPEGKTIAQVRNKGVKNSKGRVLVFLDADTLVTEQWHMNIGNLVKRLDENPLVVTGSRCLSSGSSWLSKYWFKKLNQYSADYINSGHLITSRILFDKINGFTEELKTAEDYDFSVKAKTVGAKVIEDNSLSVIHLGYPETIKDFIQRERWHGKEDFLTLNNIKNSKIAWIVIFYFFVLVAGLIVSGFMLNIKYLVFSLLILFVVSVLLTLYKYGKQSFVSTINSSIIFFLYLTGRSLAMWDAFKEIGTKTKN